MMRLYAVSTVAVALFSAATMSFSQAPCPARTPYQGNENVPTVDVIHHLMETNPDRRSFSLGDQEFILQCGAERDSVALFDAIRDTTLDLTGVRVIQTTEDSIRVDLEDNRFDDPPYRALRFDFSKPVVATPGLGEKVNISGTFASYTREPFQIIMANPSFVVIPPAQ